MAVIPAVHFQIMPTIHFKPYGRPTAAIQSVYTNTLTAKDLQLSEQTFVSALL